MEAVVSDILQSRKREPDGLEEDGHASRSARMQRRLPSFC